ncbi:MAG: hypothetical protein LBR61_05645 [Synergistaceae bacterium]|nr:hypothetical protein [Synergistaceae bacterium]
MKYRILTACLEQTQKFDTENAYQTYIKGLDRKRVRYRILDKQNQSDGSVVIKMLRDYSTYPTGDYLN